MPSATRGGDGLTGSLVGADLQYLLALAVICTIGALCYPAHPPLINLSWALIGYSLLIGLLVPMATVKEEQSMSIAYSTAKRFIAGARSLGWGFLMRIVSISRSSNSSPLLG